MKITQGLKQQQGLMMTPQLQQAIKLLTLNHLEMTEVIAKEMVENPLLEESREGEGSSDVGEVEDRLDRMELRNTESTADNYSEENLVSGKEEFDWDKYMESGQPTGSGVVRKDDERPNYENMVSREDTLAEHLLWQWGMETHSEKESQLGIYIIHCLEEDGSLQVPLEEIAAETEHSLEDVAFTLGRIQRLDPVGCGTKDLIECLLVQYRVLGSGDPLVEKVITDHLRDLREKNTATLAKELKISVERLQEIEAEISELNPRPGRSLSSEHTQYVVPDIYIYEVGGEFVVQLNDEGVPRLKVSYAYKDMLEGPKGDTRDYVTNKFRQAQWLIKSIENRQKTIYKVASAIVRNQPEFFRKGPQHLRPMILKDVAQEIGVHESTVSRVTVNKYMETPLGIFELKYFFNAGIGGKKGGIDIASESLKHKIKSYIMRENNHRPFSDQKISELLDREGVKVARRTVAKYREMMNILPSSKRKNKASKYYGQ